MHDFKKLKVWQKAHSLAIHVDRAALLIKGSERSSLRSQIIRAAGSIPANIVEGRAQRSDAEFRRFLGYAVASASELESHLILARDLKVLPDERFEVLVGQLIEVRRMLHGLVTRLTYAPSS
jgi:four helix bundle protein